MNSRAALAGRGVQRAMISTAVATLALTLLTPVFAFSQEPGLGKNSTAGSSAEAAQRPRGFLFQKPIAQIGLRGGFTLGRKGSSIFDFTTEQLTLDKSDFNSFAVGADLAFRITDPVDFVLGFTYTSTSTDSEFREFVDQDDLPITQRTTFTQIPLTASARVYLLPRGREIGRFAWVPATFSPYVGGGGGMVRYTFRQTGSFVDFQDSSIFDTTFESEGWTGLAMVMGGVDISLGPRVVLNTDARYHWASADLSADFAGFEDGIDLSGLQLSLGVFFRL